MPQFFIPSKVQMSPVARDFSETARYLGYQKVSVPDEQTEGLIKTSAAELLEVIKPQAVYEQFDLIVEYDEEAGTGEVSFADVRIPSKDLARNLRECNKVVIFASTLGAQCDQEIRRAQIKDPVKAAVLQATGAMYIEKCVDLLNEKIRIEFEEQGYKVRPRFSPGYGDVSLEVQKDFFRLLPCSRIGLTLMDTLIMSPEKSVTAFIGIKA
ncbi:MAG: hypothetical protein J5710_11145 [Treponema sp.]|nr:hypothetical protein [Treponema sp.]